MNKSFSIIIPAYNEERYLAACLDSIAAQTIMPDEVIVVDNNSSDQTADIAARYPFVRVIAATRQGIVHARDAGFNASSGDIIGRIDADTVLDADWVRQTKRYFTAHPSCHAVTGKCYFYDAPLKRLASASQAVGYHYTQPLIAGTQILWGSNMAIRQSAWAELKSHQDFEDDTDEDVVLSLRMADQAMKVRRCKAMIAGVSMRRGKLGPRQLYAYLRTWPRNYLLCGRPIQAIFISMLVPLSLVGGLVAAASQSCVRYLAFRPAFRELYASLRK